MAAFGRERRRNAELVHRLQQLHGEQVRLTAPGIHKSEYISLKTSNLGAYKVGFFVSASAYLEISVFHSFQVDTLELKKRYHELQTAHMSQAKLINGGVEAAAAPFMCTIKTQEQVWICTLPFFHLAAWPSITRLRISFLPGPISSSRRSD